MSSNKSQINRPHPEADDEIDLSRIFNILWLNKTWIGLSLVLGLLLGGLYAFTARPVYQADALLQIEPKSQNNILGDLANMAPGMGVNNQAATEIQIIRSRLVLGSTVDTLTLTAAPKYVKPGFFKGLFGEKRELEPTMVVAQFIVPQKYLGETFTLTYKGSGVYEITTPFDKRYSTKVGEIFTSPEGLVSAISAIQNAVPGDAFDIIPTSRQTAIASIEANLGTQETGKNTNILALSYNDNDSKRAQTILKTVVDYYSQQNKEYDAQVAEKSLEFIDKQLPVTRESLEQAENALNRFRNRNATIDIATESKGVVDSLNQIEMQLIDLKAKETDIEQLYTREHPVYKSILEKRAVLEKAKKQLLARISNMPTTQQDMIRLGRDVEIQQTIYLQLLQKQQELRITQASKLGNIRVIDNALTQERPIKPKKALILVAAGLGAALLTTLFFILRSLFRRGIDDTEQLESMGIPVLASVPFSEIQRKRDKLLRYLRSRNKGVHSNFLLAYNKPDDPSVEALRALRTSLFLQVMEARNNIVMVAGATPKVGKTFVSANLATVLVQSGKSVLLIDADMRKGYVHELFDMDNGTGLSDYLEEKVASAPIQNTLMNGLDLITHGTGSERPAEILGHLRFSAMLNEVAGKYDFVIVDAPPVLAVTDANIIGQQSGTTLIVTRFEETSVRDVEATVSRLRNSNVEVAGAVLNGIQRTASNYYSYDAYTRYAKKSD